MKGKSLTTLPAKLQDLYNSVRDYADARGRTLSTPFMKLPTRAVSYSLINCLLLPSHHETVSKNGSVGKSFRYFQLIDFHSINTYLFAADVEEIGGDS